MLQLKELKLIRDLTGDQAWRSKCVTFGFTTPFVAAAVPVVLASQFIPENMALLVTRIQTYVTDNDPAQADFSFYRVPPDGTAFWILATSITDTVGVFTVTSPTAPAHLVLDTDKLLLFPPNIYANLIFTPNVAAPAAGTFQIRTTVFSYFVQPNVYEELLGPMEWINFQT